MVSSSRQKSTIRCDLTKLSIGWTGCLFVDKSQCTKVFAWWRKILQLTALKVPNFGFDCGTVSISFMTILHLLQWHSGGQWKNKSIWTRKYLHQGFIFLYFFAFKAFFPYTSKWQVNPNYWYKMFSPPGAEPAFAFEYQQLFCSCPARQLPFWQVRKISC